MAEQRHFDVPAGDAESGVSEFVQQAGMSVVYENDGLDRCKTSAVKGDFEPLDALRRLVDGSELELSMVNPRVIFVSCRGLPTVTIEARPAAGSLSLTPDVAIRTVSGAELAQQGFATVPDFLRSLPANQGTGAYEGTSYLREAPTNIASGSGLNLYGIGQRSTLVLVDGRRLAPAGSAGSFTDVLNIPMSAIDHIELISDGAATVYGADAAAGIVNFVLRDGYSKSLTTATFGHLTRGDLAGSDFSQSFAWAGDGWQTIAALDYYVRSGLPASDRSQATSDVTPWGGSNFDILFGNPATLVDSAGRLWRVAGGQPSTALTAASLVEGANLYDRYADTWILPSQERVSAVVRDAFDLSDSEKIFADALFSWRRTRSYDTPVTSVLSVPSTNPYYVNPFGGSTSPVEVLYGFGKDFGPIYNQGAVNSGQLVLGIENKINSRWQLNITVGYSFDNQHESENNLVNYDVLTKSLASSDSSSAFDPFGSGTSPAVLAAIRTNGTLDYQSTFKTTDLEAVGLIPLLRSGDVTFKTGYERRMQTLASSVSPGFEFAGQILDMDQQRRLDALYMQAAAPVWSGNPAPGTSFSLNLRSGLRYEHFSDAGAAFLPSVGFALGLDHSVSLIGTWSRMFRPPNLSDLNESVNYAGLYLLADPKFQTSYTTALIWSGNNSQLRPEVAHSWMLGLKLTPPSDPEAFLDVQYFNIESFNQVLVPQPLASSVLADPQYSYLVTRNVTPSLLANICSSTAYFGTPNPCQDPTAQIAHIGAVVDLRLNSAKTLKTDGFDLQGRYSRDTSIGRLKLDLQAMYVLHFAEALPGDGEPTNLRNTPHNPTALRFRGVFGWERQHFWLGPAVNFRGSYTDTMSSPSRPVASWATWDWVMGAYIGGNTAVSLRALNVFNQQPPILNNGVGNEAFDPENGDLLGRRLSLDIRCEF